MTRECPELSPGAVSTPALLHASSTSVGQHREGSLGLSVLGLESLYSSLFVLYQSKTGCLSTPSSASTHCPWPRSCPLAAVTGLEKTRECKSFPS